MQAMLVLGFGCVMAHAAIMPVWPRTRLRKVGGIWFYRVGRLQVSFCKCRASI